MSKNFKEKIFLILFLFVLSNAIAGQTQPVPPFIRPTDPYEQPIENGVKFLEQVNLAHGGAALNNLKTLRLTGKERVDNRFYTVKILVDTISGKVRRESKSAEKGDDYFYVEQIEGKKGWAFRADEKVDYSEEESRDSELRAIFSAGLLGLRRTALENISVKTFRVDPLTRHRTIRVQINGQEYKWDFDDHGVMLSESFVNDRDDSTVLFDDFRTIKGVKIPHRTSGTIQSVAISGALLILHDWITVEVDPVLTEKDWAVPEPKKSGTR